MSKIWPVLKNKQSLFFAVLQKRDFLAIAFLVILTIIFFWKFFFKGQVPIPADIVVGAYYPWLDYKWGFPTGVPVKNPILSDVVSVNLPFKFFAIDQILSGGIPLWNPFVFAGIPLVADFLYPINIFYLIFPKVIAWSLGVIIQPLLAAIFQYLLLRHLKLSVFASLVGSIVFAFSAFSVVWMTYNVLVHAALWLPLILLVTDKFLTTLKLRWLVLASFIWAFEFFSGYPQITIYIIFAVLIFITWRLFFEMKLEVKDFILRALFAIFPFVLGAMLAAPYISTSLESILNSIRFAEKEAGGVGVSLLPWQNLITFLSPDFFGNHVTGNFWGLGNYSNLAIYVGILPLILAISIIFEKTRKIVWYFIAILILTLILILPNPLTLFLKNLNLFGFQSADFTRGSFLLGFSLASLSAFGAENFRKIFATKQKFNIMPALILLASFLGVVLGVVIAYVIFINWTREPVNQSLANPIILQDVANFKVALRNSILPGLFLLVSLGLIIIANVRFKLRYILKRNIIFLECFVLLFLIGDLFRFGWKYIPFTKSELLFPKTPVIEFLQRQSGFFRVERVQGPLLPHNFWLPYGLESASGYHPIYPLRYGQFLTALNSGDITNSVSRYGEITNYESNLFDLLNIKYLVVLKRDMEEKKVAKDGFIPQRFQQEKFKKVFEDGSVVILENKKSLPRAFLVHDYLVRAGGQETIDALLSDNFDLSKIIVLNEPLPDFSLSGKESSIDFISYLPNSSILRVNTDGNALLFVSDSHSPGWRATMDGGDSKIYRANYAFRAVAVPAGNHEIKFFYDPLSFKIGWMIGLGSLVVMVTATVVIMYKRRHWL